MCISRVLGVPKQAVLAEEFASFVDLEMTLHVGAEELLPHFRRILVSLDATPALYMGQDSPSMLEAESLARFSVLEELDEHGASNAELDRMREVLQDEVDKGMGRAGLKLPWLTDVLTEQFEELLSSSSEAGSVDGG